MEPTFIEIFPNVIDPAIISGNLTTTMSQFAIISNMFRDISGNKSNIYERDWSKFDRKKIILVLRQLSPIHKKGAIKFKESLNSDKTYGQKSIYIISSKK